MDSDDVELLRRRLEEQVKAKVEADLFRYYRNLGSIIIAVLGAVGIAVGWPAIRGIIEEETKKQITAQVEMPVEQAKKATQEARDEAAKVERIANGILVSLDERQSQLREDIGRINARYDEVAVNYGTAKTRLGTLHDQVGDLEEAISYFKELAKRDPVGRGELESIKNSIADVAAKAGELAKALGDITDGETPEISTLQEGLENVVTEQRQALEEIDNATTADPRGASTVFVQFAGGKRDDIRTVTMLLRNRGWTVPGEERIGSAAGKREVRYFHETDRKAASLLREELNAALVGAGLTGVQIADVGEPLKLSKPPAKGILEVWVEIPFS